MGLVICSLDEWLGLVITQKTFPILDRSSRG